ncbi:MAG TPA: glycoside hydrolase family 3 N-terminal domain-containing protein [Candidatus Angelobacter sp.]|nr:glycoside hydrolase family 3 N-terminal domain-containing protein [Candidatus Angelobacter sp.]
MLKLFTRIACLCLLASSLVAQDHFSKAEPVHIPEDGQRWVQKTLKGLSLEEKVGQMLNVRYFTDFQNFSSTTYQQFRDQMQKYHLGSVVLTVHTDGPILLRNGPLEVAAVANQLQKDSKLPLLIAADFERGLDSRVSGTLAFPDAMAFGAVGDPARAERYGAIVAEESRAIGIHWNFFPVADVNSNPDNPIINTRSFGEDPVMVGKMVSAYIQGAAEHGLLTTAKHFPGHGDTGTDSHLGVARVEGSLDHLKSIELPPFEQAVSAGVAAVMVAHLSVPALDNDPNKVATISTRVVTDVLEHQLGFHGVVVTDALEMRGLTSIYPPGAISPTARAAVDAVKAGDDVILWPTDLDGAFQGIIAAVKRGEIPESRIDDSVRKILEMKASVGLHRARLVDLDQVSSHLDKPENVEFAQKVSEDAITLVRDNGQMLPLTKLLPPTTESETFQPTVPPTTQVISIIITDTIHGDWGHAFEKALKAHRADATIFYVDKTIATAMSGQILQAVKDAGKVVVAAYIVPTPAKQVMVNGKMVNSVGLEEATGELLRNILEIAGPKTALIAMGNPYVAQSFPNTENYLCTFSNATSSEVGAVKVLFGEAVPVGHLPVTLPGIAQRGFGLQRFGANSGTK